MPKFVSYIISNNYDLILMVVLFYLNMFIQTTHYDRDEEWMHSYVFICAGFIMLRFAFWFVVEVLLP